MANQQIPKKYIFPTHIYEDCDTNKIIKSKRSEDGSVYQIVTDGFSNKATLQDRVNIAKNRYYQRTAKMLKETLKITDELNNNEKAVKLVQHYEDLMMKTYENALTEGTSSDNEVMNSFNDMSTQFYKHYIQNNIGTYEEFNKYIQGLNNLRMGLSAQLQAIQSKGGNTPATLNIETLSQIKMLSSHIERMTQESQNSGFTDTQLKNKMLGGFNAVVRGAIGELKNNAVLTMAKALQNTHITGGESGTVKVSNDSYKIGQVKPDIMGYYEYVEKNGNRITLQAGFSVKDYIERKGKAPDSVSGATIHLVKGASVKRFIDRLENNQYKAALNILANDVKTGAMLQALGNFLAASFVDEFLTGSFGKIGNSNDIDLASVLIYNNKAYAMSDILESLANDNIYQMVNGTYKFASLTGTLTRKTDINDNDFNLYKLNAEDATKKFDSDGHLGMQRSLATANLLLSSTTIGVTLKSSAFKNIERETKSCANIEELVKFARELDKDLKK